MIKNYSTTVSEDRTVSEIMALLAQKKARSIQIRYDQQGRPEGISFIVEIENVPIPFRLPCNFLGVHKAITDGLVRWEAKREWTDGRKTDQVRRIAWRIVKDWVAAQMALIEAEQASLVQVFLPYAVYQDGTTTFDKFIATVVRSDRALEGEISA